ncbi:MAG: hypothetical protein DRP78_03495 [Candidatus Omnitrophota bacterium]|nr:MAG: hypothetical protein DRP78_03495 [Candidatus Omnitrophota bacterium]
MNDNFKMDCSDIREKLKAFLNDLLVEDEYKLFVAHLNVCKKCKDYVRRIGSISNQLWQLGDVNVPPDLSYTILFRLKQTEQENIKSKFFISKKLAVGIFVVILALATLFFGIKYHYFSKEVDETSVVKKITM